MGCITEILKIKDDKEFLKFDGTDTIVEGGNTYKDYEYLIVLNSFGHRCGYVAIPPEHKMNGRLEKGEINCHGGVTFTGNDHHLKQFLSVPCADNWIGFDCGHYYDKPDTEALKKYHENDFDLSPLSYRLNDIYNGNLIRDFAYVEKECKSIIDQLEEMSYGH